MSWAAHNPEKYEELCIDGVASRLMRELKNAGFDDADPETIRAVVQVLCTEAGGPTMSNTWSQLMAWAGRDISCAYGNHFSGLIDAAKSRSDHAS